MGTVRYLVSKKRNKKLLIGKSSESIEVGELLCMSDCDDIEIISEHDEIANDHDSNGITTLDRMNDASTENELRDLREVLGELPRRTKRVRTTMNQQSPIRQHAVLTPEQIVARNQYAPQQQPPLPVRVSTIEKVLNIEYQSTKSYAGYLWIMAILAGFGVDALAGIFILITSGKSIIASGGTVLAVHLIALPVIRIVLEAAVNLERIAKR